jgi:hypothetical protein
MCGTALKISYLDLFNISRCKDAWVVDHMQFRMKIFIGIYSLLDQYMIGWWKWSFLSLNCYTLAEYARR